jgi:hypothetical protein
MRSESRVLRQSPHSGRWGRGPTEVQLGIVSQLKCKQAKSAKGAKKTASKSRFIDIQCLKLYSCATCALLRAFREIPTKPRFKRAFVVKSDAFTNYVKRSQGHNGKKSANKQAATNPQVQGPMWDRRSEDAAKLFYITPTSLCGTRVYNRVRTRF